VVLVFLNRSEGAIFFNDPLPAEPVVSGKPL